MRLDTEKLGNNIGIIRTIDELGRLVFPQEVVKNLSWQGRQFDFERGGDCILMLDAQKGRKLDKLNRLVIPIGIRRELEIDEGDKVEMFFYENGAILSKY